LDFISELIAALLLSIDAPTKLGNFG